MPLPYVFKEFPKLVYPTQGGEPVFVENADEEAALVVSELPTKDKSALRADAESLGVTVDGRWSVERLNTEIAAAQAAPKEES